MSTNSNEKRETRSQKPGVSRSIEAWLTNVIAGVVPWLAPVPSAALVANATKKHLAWSEPIAVIAGIIIEGLGLTSTSTALTLWDFNARKGEREPKAPFGIAALLVGVYFVSTIALTVVLDANSGLTQYAPAIFPILAIVATVNIALRSQHAHRLERIAATEEAARLAAEKVEEERKRAEAEAKAEQLRLAREADERAERLRLERKADREARQVLRQTTRQGATTGATHDAIDSDTFTRLYNATTYDDIADLCHALGYNGELKAFYADGKRSAARLSRLLGLHPRTGQRLLVASNVVSDVATEEVSE